MSKKYFPSNFPSRLPVHLQTELALFCHSVVLSHFAMFLNNKVIYRGDKFQWKNFPALAGRMGKASVGVNMVLPEKHKEAARDFVEATCKKLAERCLKEAGMDE